MRNGSKPNIVHVTVEGTGDEKMSAEFHFSYNKETREMEIEIWTIPGIKKAEQIPNTNGMAYIITSRSCIIVK